MHYIRGPFYGRRVPDECRESILFKFLYIRVKLHHSIIDYYRRTHTYAHLYTHTVLDIICATLH